MGVPISNKVFEGGGYQNFTETPKGGGDPFFTHTKKETEQRKISLLRNSPAALDAPFARFAPVALKSFRHPGEGVPIFDGDSKLYGDSEGGLRVFYWHFSQKGPPPPFTRNSDQSLRRTKRFVAITLYIKWFVFQLLKHPSRGLKGSGPLYPNLW